MATRINNGTLAHYDVMLAPKYKEFTTSFSKRKRDSTSRISYEKKMKTLRGRR